MKFWQVEQHCICVVGLFSLEGVLRKVRRQNRSNNKFSKLFFKSIPRSNNQSETEDYVEQRTLNWRGVQSAVHGLNWVPPPVCARQGEGLSMPPYKPVAGRVYGGRYMSGRIGRRPQPLL
ncbi:hypothetical protein H5410_055978 [Solanum commersonii]|uniref:Uncharacterized protein n=1 Tax=Solanum commersonii TaxID=4109 RepID=A0A9J5WKY1_SOLCO|nr:hypothetical protein H5410_055978 [Solanum commersonii]